MSTFAQKLDLYASMKRMLVVTRLGDSSLYTSSEYSSVLMSQAAEAVVQNIRHHAAFKASSIHSQCKTFRLE